MSVQVIHAAVEQPVLMDFSVSHAFVRMEHLAIDVSVSHKVF